MLYNRIGWKLAQIYFLRKTGLGISSPRGTLSCRI